MFKLSSRAASLGVKLTPHTPALHTTNPTSLAQALSTDSKPVCNQVVKQAADQLKKSQVLRTGGTAGLPTGRQVVAKVTRMEQLVWLANHSLASSSTRDVTSTARSDKDMIAHRDGEIATPVSFDCTRSWDGPTIWAHLW